MILQHTTLWANNGFPSAMRAKSHAEAESKDAASGPDS